MYLRIYGVPTISAVATYSISSITTSSTNSTSNTTVPAVPVVPTVPPVPTAVPAVPINQAWGHVLLKVYKHFGILLSISTSTAGKIRKSTK